MLNRYRAVISKIEENSHEKPSAKTQSLKIPNPIMTAKQGKVRLVGLHYRPFTEGLIGADLDVYYNAIIYLEPFKLFSI